MIKVISTIFILGLLCLGFGLLGLAGLKGAAQMLAGI
jgi:hypothetical protein